MNCGGIAGNVILNHSGDINVAGFYVYINSGSVLLSLANANICGMNFGCVAGNIICNKSGEINVEGTHVCIYQSTVLSLANANICGMNFGCIAGNIICNRSGDINIDSTYVCLDSSTVNTLANANVFGMNFGCIAGNIICNKPGSVNIIGLLVPFNTGYIVGLEFPCMELCSWTTRCEVCEIWIYSPEGNFAIYGLTIKYLFPWLEKLGGNTGVQVTPIDMMTSDGLCRSVFFYHPLTPTDMGAFDEFILEEGAYEFINGRINILGHDALLPVLEEIKKKKKIEL